MGVRSSRAIFSHDFLVVINFTTRLDYSIFILSKATQTSMVSLSAIQPEEEEEEEQKLNMAIL